MFNIPETDIYLHWEFELNGVLPNVNYFYSHLFMVFLNFYDNSNKRYKTCLISSNSRYLICSW
jgi:hypothetical protein